MSLVFVIYSWLQNAVGFECVQFDADFSCVHRFPFQVGVLRGGRQSAGYQVGSKGTMVPVFSPG